jgi:hypothetical protein
MVRALFAETVGYAATRSINEPYRSIAKSIALLGQNDLAGIILLRLSEPNPERRCKAV